MKDPSEPPTVDNPGDRVAVEVGRKWCNSVLVSRPAASSAEGGDESRADLTWDENSTGSMAIMAGIVQ